MMLPYGHSSEPIMKSVLWLENTTLYKCSILNMMLPYGHSSETTMKLVLWLENTILLVKVFIAMEYLYHKWSRISPFVVISIRSCPHSGVIIGFVTRVTRRVALMKQELLTLLFHLSSLPVFSRFVMADRYFSVYFL
jgi:hypothetical protein